MGGSFLLKLNIDSRPIANKYREGKMKRTLERELKVREIAEREANETSFISGRKVVFGHGEFWVRTARAYLDSNRKLGMFLSSRGSSSIGYSRKGGQNLLHAAVCGVSANLITFIPIEDSAGRIYAAVLILKVDRNS
jgi:hypothetical protein